MQQVYSSILTIWLLVLTESTNVTDRHEAPQGKMSMAMALMLASGPKGKGLDTCYSAAYMTQTRDQQRFIISEVAAEWHEPMVPQRIVWPSTARTNGQLDPRCS